MVRRRAALPVLLVAAALTAAACLAVARGAVAGERRRAFSQDAPARPIAQGQRQVTPPRAAGPLAEAPRGTAIVRGIVLAADTGAPIRRAQVRASASGLRTNRLATTDAQGRFEFKELPAGRYTVSASKGGFVGLQHGQRRPSESGTPIEIADRQVVEKLVIALPRGSVLSGRVFDEFGEPVANASVNAMRYGFAAGGRRYLPGGSQNARDTTDDQGQFRLFGLPPGEYVVSANFRGGGSEVTDPAGEPSGYAPTYFPGTTNVAEAQRIRLDVGQEQASINFALVATKLVRITGTIVDSQGVPVTNAALVLMAADRAAMPGLPQASGRVDRTGAFRLPDVAPGRYVLTARTNVGGGGRGVGGGRGGLRAADGAPEFARLDVAVGTEDLDGLVVVTGPGARVNGQITTDTGQPPPFRPDQLQVAARPAQPDQTAPGGAARVAADWTFQLNGLFDGRLFRVSAPQGWSLKQVLLNSEDITDTPLEFAPGQTVAGVQIVLTEKLTQLTGLVTDARRQPVVDAAVVVFPSDERLWMFQSRFIRAARPDQDGRYEIRGLPAHDSYLIVAVQGVEDGEAGDPEFLSRVKSEASAFSLDDDETKAVDVGLTTTR